MKFLAKDPIPLFLGNAGMGENFGQIPAQLWSFDVFFDVLGPMGFYAEAAQVLEVGFFALGMPDPSAGVVLGQVDGPDESKPEVFFEVAAPEPSASVDLTATPETSEDGQVSFVVEEDR